MHNPASRSATELAALVDEIRDLVFRDEPSAPAGRPRFVPDNGIEGEYALERVRTILEDAGLGPG